MENQPTASSKGFLGDYDKPLFWSSALLTLAIVCVGAISPDTLKSYASRDIRDFLLSKARMTI